MIRKEIVDRLVVKPGQKFRLKDREPGWAQTEELREAGEEVVKERAKEILAANLADLGEAQALLYADNRYSILVVLQAMDAAGKDGTIKHVMSGVNPQGCRVFSFKQPFLPLALHEVPPGTRAHRDLQPVLLRGRPGREGSSGVARQAEPSAG